MAIPTIQLASSLARNLVTNNLVNKIGKSSKAGASQTRSLHMDTHHRVQK